MKWYISVVPPDSGEICDFCSSTPVYAAYQCEDFVCVKNEDYEESSIGAWAACKTCSDLIEAERWKDLLERSVETFMQTNPMPEIFNRSLVKKSIGAAHELFRKHRRMAS